MATMSHTTKQRNEWRASKRRPHETTSAAFNRARKNRNNPSANTPKWTTRGVTYLK